MEPALYTGTLAIGGFAGARHNLRIRYSCRFLDVTEYAEPNESVAVRGYDRWNWTSFDNRDYFGDLACRSPTPSRRCESQWH